MVLASRWERHADHGAQRGGCDGERKSSLLHPLPTLTLVFILTVQNTKNKTWLSSRELKTGRKHPGTQKVKSTDRYDPSSFVYFSEVLRLFSVHIPKNIYIF